VTAVKATSQTAAVRPKALPWRGRAVLSAAAMFSGAALVVTVSLALTLLCGSACVAALGRRSFLRLPPAARPIVLERLRTGLLAGVAATAAYDLARLALVEAAGLRFWPFDTLPLFGQAILGTGFPQAAVLAVGTGYHPGYLQDLMASVYPASGGNNCWDIAQAISHSLATGQVQPAVSGSAPVTPQGMADATGGDLEDSSLGQIDQTMAGAPSGSQGWVVVDDPATGNAHVFNAVNINGQAYFMDGETHTVAGSAEAIAQATHYTGGDVIVGFIPLF
jgi:hypothetical protein